MVVLRWFFRLFYDVEMGFFKSVICCDLLWKGNLKIILSKYWWEYFSKILEDVFGVFFIC